MTEKRLIWKKYQDIVYHAFNDKNEDLGYLVYERVGSWMHWCWYQNEDKQM